MASGGYLMSDQVKEEVQPKEKVVETKVKKTTAKGESIYEALAKAQSEFAPIKRTKKAAYGKYAPLEELLGAVRAVLNKHGLFLTQKVTSDTNALYVETVVYHSSGESLSSGILATQLTQATGRMNVSQMMGSARTYACRYSLASFLGLVDADDDDAQSLTADLDTNMSNEQYKDIEDKARLAASKGMYDEYFKSVSIDTRKYLVSSGLNAELRK